MNRGHVDQEAAGQRDMTGDPRALLAQRFLGDLDDDFLTGLEHFRNELRPPRSGMAAVMAGCTALESLTATITATAIGTSAVIATERPLEARTRIAADAGGIPGVIFAGRTGAGSAGFAG